MRRLAAVAEQLTLALDPEPADPRLGRTLHRLDEARELVVSMLDGAEPPPVKWEPHPLIPLSALPVYEPPDDRRFVVRKGRICGDGTRRGARLMRRMTLYMEPATFEELEAYCLAEDVGLSETIETAVIEMLERR
jgi:hypothetical protein